MLSFLARRLIVAIPTILAVITLSFFMMQAAPGSPFTGGKLSPAVEQNLRAQYGLDRPVAEQYLRYVGGVVQGDFGPSLKYPGRSVADIVADGFPTSLLIGFAALVIGGLAGVGLAVAGAMRRGRWVDRLAGGVMLGGLAVPTFVTAPILALIFGSWLQLLPSGGIATSRGYVLPIIVLALPLAAAVTRIVRSGMVETLDSQFVRTARARGLSEQRIARRYALPLALLPLVSFLAPATAALITGSFVVEQFFGIPGLWRAFVMSAVQRDYTVIMGTVILYSVLIIILNLVADVLYRVLDPRVRLA